MLRLSTHVQLSLAEGAGSNSSTRVCLAREGGFPSSVSSDLDYLSKREGDGIDAIKGSAGKVEVKDEDVIDLVDYGTPSSSAPTSRPPPPPPPPTRRLVSVHKANMG